MEKQLTFNFFGDNDNDIVDYDIVTDDVPKRTKRGDIWQLGKHRLMCGDCTNDNNIQNLIKGRKIKLLLTDPPYGIKIVSNNGQVGADFGITKKGKYKEVIADDSTDTAKKMFDILKKQTDKQIIFGGNYFTNFLPFSDGWLIWDKRVDSGIRNTFADGEMAWCSFHTPIRIYHQLWNGMIRTGEKDKRIHPTQKPVKVISEIIKDFTKEGEEIIDVFGGSGTTLIACELLNRVCYMMEIDEDYVNAIIYRWETLTRQEAKLLYRKD